MNIRLKLYASLGAYLPAGAEKNEAETAAPEGATVQSVLDACGAPRAQCHLVLLNGLFVPPESRAEQVLQDGDHLAAWPPVAGG